MVHDHNVATFAHLNVKTDFSTTAPSALTVKEACKLAQQHGHTTIGFTEALTMRGVYEIHEAAAKHGLKPIYGVQVWLCKDAKRKAASKAEKDAALLGVPRDQHAAVLRELEADVSDGRDDSRWLTLWAGDAEGLRSLFMLTSASWLEGFYYKPRVDLRMLREHATGVWCGTGGFDGALGTLIAKGDRPAATKLLDGLQDIFGDRLLLEIQPHRLLPQARLNVFAVEQAKARGLRCIATQAPHYATQSDLKHYRMLAAIATDAPPDEAGLPGDQHWFKSSEEMLASFASFHPKLVTEDVLAAMQATSDVADALTASLTIDKINCLMPNMGDAPDAALEARCAVGWTWRGMDRRAAEWGARRGLDAQAAIAHYRARLTHELAALASKKFAPYILLVGDIYKFAREQGIYCGPGRGSGAGSLVNYLIGITSVDPIEHELLFERFISPVRNDMPDIDMDFEDARRHEIIAWIKQRFGPDHTAQIATWSRLKGPAIFGGVMKRLGVTHDDSVLVRREIDRLVKERKAGNANYLCTVADACASDVGKRFSADLPHVVEACARLEGRMTHVSKHAAGVIASPIPLREVVPLESFVDDKGNRAALCAVDMVGAQAMRLLKLDCLGLITMSVVRLTCEAVQKSGGKLDLEMLENMTLDDPKVIQAFSEQRFEGVFQFDSHPARKACKGMIFADFADIAAVNALNRPGTSSNGMQAEFVKRRNDPSKRTTLFHKKVDEITADACGIILYQEHVNRIFVDVAGYDAGNADAYRRKISKSKGEEDVLKTMVADGFVARCIAHTPDLSEERADALMRAIAKFGGYSFNKSHAVAYGVIAYWCMYLKLYYPLEFWAAMLSCDGGKDATRLVKAAAKDGVKLLGPDISKSKTFLSVDREQHAIRAAITDVAGVGLATAQAIVASQPYVSLEDFAAKIWPKGKKSPVNKAHVLALAKAGAFDAFISRKQITENIEAVLKSLKAGKAIEVDDEADYDEEQKQAMAAAVTAGHGGDQWSGLANKLPIEIADMADEEFLAHHEDDAGTWIRGTLEPVRTYTVGQFDRTEPDDAEKERMGYGKRYGSGFLEDASGAKVKVKFDVDTFPRYEAQLAANKPIDCLIFVKVNKPYRGHQVCRVICMVPMKAIADAMTLTTTKGWPCEVMLALGTPPHSLKKYKSQDDARRAKWSFSKLPQTCATQAKKSGTNDATGTLVGTVVSLRLKNDKNNAEMAWIGLAGCGGFVELTAFARVWAKCPKVQIGDVIRVAFRWTEGDFYVQESFAKL